MTGGEEGRRLRRRPIILKSYLTTIFSLSSILLTFLSFHVFLCMGTRSGEVGHSNEQSP